MNWAPAIRREALVWAAVVALLGLFLLQCADLARRTSCTVDEDGHLGAGASWWSNGDYRLLTSNLFFAQRVAGLGPIAAGYAFPSKPRQAELKLSPNRVGQEYLFRMGHDPVALLATARFGVTLLGAAAGLAVFLWARHLFGATAGIIALGGFVLCPPVVGNASLVTTDIATALAYTAAAAAYWWYLCRPGIIPAMTAGLATALLVLTKFSAIGFFVAAAVMLLWRAWRGPRPFGWTRCMAGHAIIAVTIWVGIWAFFGFRAQPGGYSYNWDELGRGTIVHRTAMAARRFHLVPDPFIADLGGLRLLVSKRYSYFAGEHRYGGSPGYFLGAVLLKTPPALLAAALVAAAAALPATRRRQAGAQDADGNGLDFAGAAPLWILMAVFIALCMASGLNIGHRHLLPIYPPLCILAGGGVIWLWRRHWPGRFIAAGLALAVGAEAAWLHGRQLAYLSPLAGGPRNCYRWFVDSSLDWGANLPQLAAWQRAATNAAPGTRFYLGQLGVDPVEAYGVQGTLLTREGATTELRGGCYVLSATALIMGYIFQPGPYTEEAEREYQQERRTPKPRVAGRDELTRLQQLALARLSACLRHRAPNERIGDVYFVFRLTDSDAERILTGPLPAGLPEPPMRLL